MYPATPTFWLEPTDQVARGLRRYIRCDDATGYDCAHGYHSTLVYIDRQAAHYDDETYGRRTIGPVDEIPHDDPRWPTTCACGYVYSDEDHWQTWQELIYRRTDTGAEHVLHSAVGGAPDAPSAPPGASWDAWWMPDDYRGPDGIALMVRCPSGRDWCVDSQASNCTRPGEPHACWVRHGDPREYHVTVDKNGDTCAAGAGSIIAGDYHGFLRGGTLTAG